MAPKAPIIPNVCPLCGFSSKRNTTFDEHVLEAHNMTVEQLYLSQHPNSNLCRCGCKETTKFITFKQGFSEFIIGHNANLYSSYDEETAKKIAATRGTNWKERPPWKGKTKDKDEASAKRAAKTAETRKKKMEAGEIVTWNKGLTKETDKRLADYSEHLKQQFAEGIKTPWAKGLNKKNDTRIAEMANKVSMTHRTIDLRKRLDTLKRLSQEEITARLEGNNKFEIVFYDINNYINATTQDIQVKCKNCGEVSYSHLEGLRCFHCPKCDPWGSDEQRQVTDFMKEFDVTITTNDRSIIMGEHHHAELDIYVKEYKFAIEYNGLYWHSELRKSDSYHQNKSDQCNAANIKLFHIFSDEWLNLQKREIIKSMIRYRLQKIDNKIYARKTSVIQLTNDIKRKFFNENHIDGDVMSELSFGLLYNDELVMAISLRRPFHQKYKQQNYIEVARIATKINTNVVGGLTKLTTYVENFLRQNTNYQQLLTYVDTRHGHNNDWTNLGWTLITETTPRFWWTDYSVRYNRFKFKADKKNNLTEQEVAKQAGVYKIYGCKNIVYTKPIVSTNTKGS